MVNNGPQMCVYLPRIKSNYMTLTSMILGAQRVAAVIKSDAYGMGLEAVGKALRKENCLDFFVGTTNEAIRLRDVVLDARIVVLYPHLDTEIRHLKTSAIAIVINSEDDLRYWFESTERIPAYLRVDLGLSTLGVSPDVLERTLKDNAFADHTLLGIIGHLSTYREDRLEYRLAELALFQNIAKWPIKGDRSLASSDSILLGSDYHFDIVRSGSFILGYGPAVHTRLPQASTFDVVAPILAIRPVRAGHSVGYDGGYVARSDRLIALVGIGYAHGFRWSPQTNLKASIGVHRIKSVGENSMEYTAFDVTDVPATLLDRATHVSLISEELRIDEWAQCAQMLPHELGCLLGRTSCRIYVE